MKFKKLLPIATIASIAGIVTPLVTSCNGYKKFKIPASKDLHNYVLVGRKGGLMEYNSQTDIATETYFNDVKKNKKIFVDDYIQCFHGNPDRRYNEWLYVGKIDAKKGRVYTKDVWKTVDKTVDGRKNDATYTYEYNNLKWVVHYGLLSNSDYTNNWNVTLALKTVDQLKADKEWSYKFTSKVYDHVFNEYVEKSYTINWSSSEEDLKEVEAVLFKYSEDMPSYYLSKTGLAQN